MMRLRRHIAGLLSVAMLLSAAPGLGLTARATEQDAPVPIPATEELWEPAVPLTPAASAQSEENGVQKNLVEGSQQKDSTEQTPLGEEETGLDLSVLKNIAAEATITQVETPPSQWGKQEPAHLVDNDYNTINRVYCGGISGLQGQPAWVELRYQEARSIGGVEVAFERKDNPPAGEGLYTYTYDLFGITVNGESVTIAENATANRTADGFIKQHALSEMQDLVAIRLEIKSIESSAGADPWPIVSEIKVFGEAGEVPNPEPEPDPDQDGLLQIASECEITVKAGDSTKGNLVDGNLNTYWAQGNSSWPTDLDFALPGNLLIKKVEIDFLKETQYPDRTVNIMVSRAVNNVTSDYEKLYDAPQTSKLLDTFVYESEEAKRMTHVRLSLSGPNPSTLWPAVAEVRIYAVNEDVALETYDNIAPYAKVTSVGGDIASDALTDGNYNTLYKYFSGTLADLPEGDDAAWIEMDFGDNQQVRGFEVAFEKPGTPSFAYTYNLFYRSAQSNDWVRYQVGETAKRADGENVKQYKFPYMQGVSAIRFELTGVDPATAWPALAELKVFGEYTAPATDEESLAWKKPVHGNFNAATTYLVNDGNRNSSWVADMYPAYVDIDLEANYDLDEIQVFTSSTGYEQYSVYTSLDNRDFDLVGEKQDKTAPTEEGDSYALSGKAARYVRVYMEYNSADVKPVLNEVRVLGAPSQVPLQDTPAINVVDFEDSAYNVPITDELTIGEVQAIIRRNIGAAYIDWFTFELAEQDNGYDYFTLTDEGGKIKVTGNNGVSLATGVNHYLKYFCNVHISQVGSQVAMPAAVIPVGEGVHMETKFPVRYAYNYCTHSYSMPFWGEEEWQIERDWLALNGVNLVLDITGQEEVMRRFLSKIGYTHQEAKDFIAGPAYYAWAYMANLTGFGGPVHDSWFEDRTELARENQLAMRKLGMDVSLQGYSGMIPVDLGTKHPELAKDIITQGTWCSFRRPDMLRTDSQTYANYAALFYQAQEEVFGKTARYYATDPFHEGGNTGGMSTETVASKVLDSLIAYDDDAVWVIQSWQGNPSSGLLKGLRTPEDRRDHAIVLDLYAEKTENWKTYGEDTDGDGLKEFSDTPWVFCQLNNFGGRMGLHGHLDNVAERIPAAANSTQHMTGIGITPEASQNNPLIYDFLFETIWTQDADQPLAKIDVDQWLADYARRRYGAESEKAVEVMEILASTVYKANLNMDGQGAPESVVNARPALSIGAASTWGNAIIRYNKTELEKAARLLLEEYDTMKDSDAYLYDLADILKQVLSNSAQEYQKEMADAYREGDAEAFAEKSQKFLETIDMIERVLSTRPEFLFGKWTTNASELADNADDFTQRLYLFNAKALVTTWGSINQANGGGLKDYSNRQWAGLTNDYYKSRWTMWINGAKSALAGGSMPSINWFEYEWDYARDQKTYSNIASGESLQTLGEQVMTGFTSPVEPPEPSDEFDIDYKTTTAAAGSEQASEQAANAVDGNTDTVWHTNWYAATPADMRYITIDLGEVKTVNGMRYLPRQSGSNGIVTEYKISVSSDGAIWNDVATGKWAANARWKLGSFEATDARYVRLWGVQTVGDVANKFMSAAEVRVTAPSGEPPVDPEPPTEAKGEVTVTGPKSAGLNETLSYGLALANFGLVEGVQFDFEVDSTLVTGKDMELADGFTSIGGIQWLSDVDGVAHGRVIMGALNGGKTINELAEVLKLSFTSKGAEGTAKFKLLGAKITRNKADGTGAESLENTIKNAEVTTVIGNRFDFNHDGKVDLLDLTMMMPFYMSKEGSADWTQAQKFDVTDDGRVDMDDMLLVLHNFSA